MKYGMVIDLDSCTGCGACSVACAVENNIPPANERATERTGITWMNVREVTKGGYPAAETVWIPMSCQQCGEETPCVSVCPQNAVEVDPVTGIVGQIPERCLGCRYCMAACPYHARYFNWWDPAWPEGMTAALNPESAPRMRGVVEKCNFCLGRLHAARQKAGASGPSIAGAVTEGAAEAPLSYTPACVECCPARAITFGNLDDPGGEVAKLAASSRAFRFLPRLGTEPAVHYLTDREWVKALAERQPKEQANG